MSIEVIKMKTVALYGCGAIGNVLAEYLDKENFAELIGIFDLRQDAMKDLKSKLKKWDPIAVNSIEDLLDLNPDIVIEAASPKSTIENAEKILERTNLMLMCTGTLFKLYDTLLETAEITGHKVYAPSGAIAGIDAVKSAEIGGIEKVMIATSKNPRSIEQTSYLNEKEIYLSEITEPTVLFEGPAEQAVKYFPNNTNVSATLSYAAKSQVIVKLVADPNIETNQHEIFVKGEFGELYTRVRNVPSPNNPKTSYLAALSAARTLKKIFENIEVGT